jgi:hypothetical protein
LSGNSTEPEATARGLDVAAERRDSEIAALFELGDRGLADAEACRELSLCQIPCLAQILERLILGMSRSASASIRARRSGVSCAILSFSAMPIGSSLPCYEMAIELMSYNVAHI